MDIIWILAHALTLIIRYLGNIHAVTCCSLHNYVERFIARIVGYICSYSKCNLDLVLEIAVEFVCFLEIKAVAESFRKQSVVMASVRAVPFSTPYSLTHASNAYQLEYAGLCL